MKSEPLTGLVAATFTPFDARGEVNFELIPRIADYLVDTGVSGIYICGSTGEGPSLTTEERKAVAQAYVDATRNRMRTVVHVGHSSIKDAVELSAHAKTIGAHAISAIAPYYFKPETVGQLIDFYREIAAAAAELPFYYYHIPALTGVAIDPLEFLQAAGSEIPNLRGIKYTDSNLSTLNLCQTLDDGSYDVLFGRDEMLLSSLVSGVKGAVGSTYNLAPCLYRRIIHCYEAGDLEGARDWQQTAVRMIKAIVSVGGESAIKYPMHRHGLDCGQRRLPMKQLSEADKKAIDRGLDDLGFDEWAAKDGKEASA